jgi:hypothetical protein
MRRRVIDLAFFSLLAFVICGCSRNGSVMPPAGATTPLSNASLPPTKNSQYLYVYDAGSPGIYTGEYARYNIPDLTLEETTAASGVASHEAFSGALPYFVDEATGHAGFAVYLQPIKNGTVTAQQEFYGVPCESSSLSTDSSGNFYAVQYCSTNVLEYKAGASKKPKKPIATFTGGNLGVSGVTNPTYAIVDPKGDLYVGDDRGGVTYFKAGSTKGIVAFPTGSGGYVNQMAVDRNGDVWSVHGPNPANVYFENKTSCVPDPSGTIVRNELAERFSKGKLAQQLYTETSDSPLFSDNGDSIAVDSSGRVYTGLQNADVNGVVLDFDPGKSCPNDGLSFALDLAASPQVAVDAKRDFYVTDYKDNTISAYKGGSKKLIKKITQKKSNVAITYTAIGP